MANAGMYPETVMRKPALTFVVLCFSMLLCHGKAYFYSQDELIRKAEVIVIIDLGEPVIPKAEAVDPFMEADDGRRGKTWNYRQCAKAKVIEVIKGKIDGKFMMYGGETFICAQCNLGKGRFLAFLTKDGKMWVGANWHLSLRPVTDGKIEWFPPNEQRYPMTMQAQDAVLGQVRRVLVEGGGEADAEPGTTIPARLRAVAETEQVIAGSLIDAFASLLGAKPENLKPAEQQLIRSLVAKQVGVAKAMGIIEKELGWLSGRDGGAESKVLLMAMQDAQVTAGLDQTAKKIAANYLYAASEDAMSWSKLLGGWADDLEGKPSAEEAGKAEEGNER